MYASEHTHTCHSKWELGSGDIWWEWLSPSAIWVTGIELRLLDLAW